MRPQRPPAQRSPAPAGTLLRTFPAVFAGLLAAAGFACISAYADDAGAQAIAATAALYADMSAQDLRAVVRLLPAEGFDEVGPDTSGPHHLDAKAVAGLFGAGLAIDLRASDLSARTFGDTAIVTGMRLGGVGPAGHAPPAGRLAFTMVWTRDADHWLLRHVHLSAPAAAK